MRAQDFKKGDRVAELVYVSGRRDGTPPKRNTGTVIAVERKTVRVKFDGVKDQPVRRVIPNRLERLDEVDPIVRDTPGKYPVLAAAMLKPSLVHKNGFEVGTTAILETPADAIEFVPFGQRGKCKNGQDHNFFWNIDNRNQGLCQVCGVAVDMSLPDRCSLTFPDGTHHPVLEPCECGYEPPCECGGATEHDVHSAEGCWDRCDHGGRAEKCDFCIKAAEVEVEEELAFNNTSADDEEETTEVSVEEEVVEVAEDNNDQVAAEELLDDALQGVTAFLELGDDFRPVLEAKRKRILDEIESKRGEVARIDRALALLDAQPPRARPVAVPNPEKKQSVRSLEGVRGDMVIGGRDHVTLERALAIVGCGKTTLYRKCQQGELSMVKKGGRTFFPIAELERIDYRPRKAASK